MIGYVVLGVVEWTYTPRHIHTCTHTHMHRHRHTLLCLWDFRGHYYFTLHYNTFMSWRLTLTLTVAKPYALPRAEHNLILTLKFNDSRYGDLLFVPIRKTSPIMRLCKLDLGLHFFSWFFVSSLFMSTTRLTCWPPFPQKRISPLQQSLKTHQLPTNWGPDVCVSSSIVFEAHGTLWLGLATVVIT